MVVRFRELILKTCLTLLSFAACACAVHPQIAPPPGIPPIAQAQQAFATAQAQSMMMTSQAQVQSVIAARAAMLTNFEARSIFLGQAAALQARVAWNQGAMLSSQTAALQNMRHTQLLQGQLQAQAAILAMRSRGIDNASAVERAVQLASISSIDPLKAVRLSAMLHAAAAQTAGQTGAKAQAQGTADASAAADPATLPAEAPPMMIRPTFGNSLSVEKPKFSVEPGKVTAGTRIRIKSETHYATMYYTTNGWTPTTQSAKYTGPITIERNTHLEVIAMGPNYLRSGVEQADYKVENSPAPVVETTIAVPADGVLHAGTPVRVVFTGKDIDSDVANVGDDISMVLDEDILVDGKLLTPRGTPINAALTIADPGHGPAPGDLVFEIHSVQVGGKRVPLFGGETLEGTKGGKEAVIKPGMTAVAFVSADVALK